MFFPFSENEAYYSIDLGKTMPHPCLLVLCSDSVGKSLSLKEKHYQIKQEDISVQIEVLKHQSYCTMFRLSSFESGL